MRKSILRGCFIVLTALMVAFSSSFPVGAMEPAIKTDQYFKDANVQIMTKECDEQAANSAATQQSASPVSSVTGGGGGGCGEKTDNSKINKDQVWSFFNGKFTEAGYTTEEAEKATSGIMGNWERESTFNPDKHNSANKGAGCTGASGPISGNVGLGIAQWCGSRQQELADFAKEKGTDISCLGTQLEFTWKEMEQRNLPAGMKGVSPSEAASIFNLGGRGAQGFEIGADNGIRMGHADKLYGEYTGQAPSALGNTPTSTSPGTNPGCAQQNNVAGKTGGAPTSSGNCEMERARFDRLVAEGKIDISNREAGIRDDVSKCQETVDCHADGGVHPRTLGLINDIAEHVGAIPIWNFKQGHPDDHGGADGTGCNRNHPHGKAVDIPCGANTKTDMQRCRDVIDYIIANKDKIGYTELIWQQNYRCDSGVDCTVSGHTDHIHIGGRSW